MNLTTELDRHGTRDFVGLRSDESRQTSHRCMRPWATKLRKLRSWHQYDPRLLTDGACDPRIRSSPRASARDPAAPVGGGHLPSARVTNFTPPTRGSGPSDTALTRIVPRANRGCRTAVGYTIGDLWDINPTSFGRVDDFVAPSKDYGEQVRYWHGVDVNISGRMRNSLMFQGGTSTGRLVTDNCDVTPKLDNPSERFCRVVAPFARHQAPRNAPQLGVHGLGEPFRGKSIPGRHPLQKNGDVAWRR